MKRIYLTLISLVVLVTSLSLTSCSKSDDDNGGGGSSTSIEGTWYLKSVKGFYYYPADGKFEPHNSNKEPDAEYDDYSNNVVMTVTKNGENLTTKWKGDGYFHSHLGTL